LAEGQLIIDATKKGIVDGHAREWPDEIVMSSEVIRSIKERASSLGIKDLYHSGVGK
jgi:3-polyprenyl-4-hydroxybenzoate decarboxylase